MMCELKKIDGREQVPKSREGFLKAMERIFDRIESVEKRTDFLDDMYNGIVNGRLACDHGGPHP